MREESKLRLSDEEGEKEVAKFLDKYFYIDKYFPNAIFTRANCFGLQIKGVDVVIVDDNIHSTDEKAAVAYINKDLKTFAFEISFINRFNNISLGWFIDKNKINTHYTLVWLVKCKKTKSFTLDDIEEVDIAYISKDKLYEFFKNKGWSAKKLLKKSKYIRSGDDNLGSLKVNDFRFHFSNQLVEKPINVIISKRKIKELSDKFITITT